MDEPEAEGVALLGLFRNFVDAATLEAMSGLLGLSEFHALVQILYNKAPEAVEHFAKTILEIQHQDSDHQNEEEQDSDHQVQGEERQGQWVGRKKRFVYDLSYRPSRSRHVQQSDETPDEPVVREGKVNERESTPSSRDSETPSTTASLPETKEQDLAASPEEARLQRIGKLRDIVAAAVQTIYEFKEHQGGIPTEVYSLILTTRKRDRTEAPEICWSDSARWVRILDIGSTNRERASILDFIGSMGASEWYDREVHRLSKARRGGASSIRVLDRIQLRRFRGLFESEGGIVQPLRDRHRNRIKRRLRWGRKLSSMVFKLGFGILFHPGIRQFVNLSDKALQESICDIQADQKYMELLQILGDQLELMLNNGEPDPRILLDSLQDSNLLSPVEYGELSTLLFPHKEIAPEASVNAAVDKLIHDLAARVLGSREFEGSHEISIDGDVDLTRESLEKLYVDKEINNWLIRAGMRISDKLPCVRIGYSISLCEPSRKGFKLRRGPLANLMDIVRACMDTAPEDPLVFLYPLHVNENHFTLLEINCGAKAIHHYNSLRQDSRVSAIIEELRDLKFKYDEPLRGIRLQNDTTSCGLMVIQIAALRMLGFPIPDTQWDPNLLRMDFINSLRTCMMDDAMQDSTIQTYESGAEVDNHDPIEGSGTQQDPMSIG